MTTSLSARVTPAWTLRSLQWHIFNVRWLLQTRFVVVTYAPGTDNIVIYCPWYTQVQLDAEWRGNSITFLSLLCGVRKRVDLNVVNLGCQVRYTRRQGSGDVRVVSCGLSVPAGHRAVVDASARPQRTRAAEHDSSDVLLSLAASSASANFSTCRTARRRSATPCRPHRATADQAPAYTTHRQGDI